MNLSQPENTNGRVNLGHRSHHFLCPNLLNIQLDSYDWLVNKQLNKISGIEELFQEFFPVSLIGKQKRQLKIIYDKYRLSSPICSISDAKKYELNYEARLYASFKLVDGKTGEVLDTAEVFLTNLPIMTKKGNFIINGSEKVIISQILRSPAPFFSTSIDKKLGIDNYDVTLIPLRGTWLSFLLNKQNNCHLKIDRSRKINMNMFLRALGLPVNLIQSWYANTDLPITDEEPEFEVNPDEAMYNIFHKIRPGDPFSIKQAVQYVHWLLFDQKRCTLSNAGRYKVNTKLTLMGRILDLKLAEDIVDHNKKVVLAKNTIIDLKNLRKFEEALEKGYLTQEINLTMYNNQQPVVEKFKYNAIKVFTHDKKEITLLGIDENEKSPQLSPVDIFVTLNYLLHLRNEIGQVDDIDDLSNRHVLTAGKLIQKQMRLGFVNLEKTIKERLSTAETFANKLKTFIPYLTISNILKTFFNTSQLTQFMDQTNPLSELSNKRRLTVLGPGGLSQNRASLEARDVHNSYYGRICPVKTSEGPKIGLTSHLACFARVNEHGFLQSPYYKVNKGVVSDEFIYLSADIERNYVIAQASSRLDKKNKIISDQVICRHKGNNIVVSRKDVHLMDVSPKQIVSASAACIPFLEYNDAARNLMGCNMHTQALPLITSEAPLVGTGFEEYVAKYSGLSIVSKKDGTVISVDAREIIVETDDTKRKLHYKLDNFQSSNQGTQLHHKPIVELGQKIKAGDVIADGSGIDNGELALGKNLLTAYMSSKGHNFEDAFIISERLVKEDIFTSLHVTEFVVEFRKTRLGDEEMTRDIPNVSEHAKRFLDENGLVIVGSEVQAGDVLVGKVTPKQQTATLSAEDNLLKAIFGKKSYNVQNSSLKVPNGKHGVVLSVDVFDCRRNDNFSIGVSKIAKVKVIQKRKIKGGDKISGRFGNKGVIAKILPQEDMPHLANGTAIDIIFNPLSVPPRMNPGQLLSMHLGLAAQKQGVKYAVPIFEGLKGDVPLESILDEAGIENYGQVDVYDGETGEKYKNPVTVGVSYILKLSHMVDDKMHARCTGPYSLITQQPLGGKAQNGGQRFGEMEVWAIEAYGAANLLREMLTLKSDDVVGRVETYNNIINGKKIPEPQIPESFLVFKKELNALNLKITYDEEEIDDKSSSDNDDEADYPPQPDPSDLDDDIMKGGN